MASKRNLKKGINNLAFELISECFTYKLFHPEQSHDKTYSTMNEILKKRNELIDKVNNPLHKEDYKKNKTFYKGIEKELNTMVSLMDNLA